jgi:hypothetical protein
MKCLQFGGLLDFYGKCSRRGVALIARKAPILQGKAFRHSFWHFLARQEATGGQRSTSPLDETLRI